MTAFDLNGNPVINEQFRIVAQPIVKMDNGAIIGGLEEWDGSARPLPAGGFARGESLNNTINVRTDHNAEAVAHYQPPTWKPFLADKAVGIVAWYGSDGSTKHLSAPLRFRKPKQN